jgi:hypothetical protein
VVWLRFDPETLALRQFLFFGGMAGQPLPSLEGFGMAKHTKGNAAGVKLERPNLRVVPSSRFQNLASVTDLYAALFTAAHHA